MTLQIHHYISFGGDVDFDCILENIFFGGGDGGVEDGVDTFFGECDIVDITYADGFDSICFGGDNNIFLGECGGGGGVEGGVDTFFGEGDVVVGGTIQKP